MDNIIIRELKIKDLQDIADFLMGQNMPVSKEGLKYLLEHNSGLSQGLFINERLSGMVLCSFDGLRGYLNKLVVAAEYRNGGYGQKLIAVVASNLRERNCPELVINCKPFLEKWYEKQGFIKQDSSYYVLPLRPSGAETIYACG
jgi:ribosomal protein S18 acetylase RimI-like enzyme